MDRSVYNRRFDGWGEYHEDSTSIPGFHRLRDRKIPLPLHPYSFDRSDGKSGRFQTYNGEVDGRDTGHWQNVPDILRNGRVQTGYAGGFFGTRFTSVSDMHARIGNKLLDKARNSPVDLGVSLGEYRETAKFFVSAVKRVTSLVKKVKKRDISVLRDFAGDVALAGRTSHKKGVRAAAHAHLEFTYAVKPIIRDVQGSIEAIRSNDPYVEVKRIRVSISEDAHSHLRVDPFGPLYSADFRGNVRGSGYLQFLVDNPLLFTADQLGLINLPALAWELTPWSFVVDWFVDIGGFLGNIIPPQGVSSVKGWTYVKARGMSRHSVDDDYLSQYGGWHTHVTNVGFVKDRRILSDFPNYTLFRPDLSKIHRHIADGTALLVQTAYGRRRK